MIAELLSMPAFAHIKKKVDEISGEVEEAHPNVTETFVSCDILSPRIKQDEDSFDCFRFLK